MKARIVLLALLLAACRSTIPSEPDHPEAIQALVEEGREPILAQLAVKVEAIETKLDPGKPGYRLGVHDVLHVYVAGHPEFSASGQTTTGEILGIRVQDDGMVYLPLLGGVPAAGRTALEVQADLKERLGKYVKEPFVSVDVLRHESQRYYLLGAVERPGAFPVDGRTTLLDAVGRVGGMKQEADLEGAYVVRGRTLLPVSLHDLLLRGDTRQNVYLEHRDFIFVPRTRESAVYVLGEVGRAGPVPITSRGLSLAAALAEAGGINPLYASRKEVVVFRGGWANPKAYTLSLRDVHAYGTSIPLKPHDTVVVAASGLATWNRVVTLLLPFLQVPLTATGVAAVSQ